MISDLKANQGDDSNMQGLSRFRLAAYFAAATLTVALLAAGCENRKSGEEIKAFVADNVDEIISKEAVSLDFDKHFEGESSFRIAVNAPTVISLYDVRNPGVDNATVVYSAYLSSEELDGEAFLEMWCSFADGGSYFSRGLDNVISGNSDWTQLSAEFFLQEGEKPDSILLNLVINGSGTVWTDRIRLEKETLPKNFR